MSRKSKHLSDQIFTFWLFLVLLAEVTFFLSSHNLYKSFHDVYEFVCGSHVLHGTVLYFYVLSFLNGTFRFKRKHLLHLLPFVVFTVYRYTVKSLELVDCLEEGSCSHSDNVYAQIAVYMKFFINFGYVSLACWEIHKLRRVRREKEFNSLGYRWITGIGHGALILALIILGIKILGIFGVRFLFDQVMLINIVVSIFVVTFVYSYNRYAYVLSQPFVVTDKEKTEEEKVDEESVGEIKQNEKEVSVDSDLDQELYSKICTEVENNLLFTDGDLTLRKLSSIIGMQEHVISKTVNHFAERSYSDFINQYRVNYFIAKVKDGEHKEKTLLALAFECGFNSKSSFNRVFKQFQGKTPSEYVRDNFN